MARIIESRDNRNYEHRWAQSKTYDFTHVFFFFWIPEICYLLAPYNTQLIHCVTCVNIINCLSFNLWKEGIVYVFDTCGWSRGPDNPGSTVIFVFHLLANAASPFISEETKTCYLKYFTADWNSFDFFPLGIKWESSGNFPQIKLCDLSLFSPNRLGCQVRSSFI